MDLKRQNKHVSTLKRANIALFANAFRKTHLFSGHYLTNTYLYQLKPNID